MRSAGLIIGLDMLDNQQIKMITTEKTLNGWWIASTIHNNQFIKVRGDTKKGAVKLLREMIKSA